MLNRAIIEINILNDEYTKDRILKIKSLGLLEAYKKIMREIYSIIDDTLDCNHILIEAIFDIKDADYGIRHYLIEGKEQYYEQLFFRYYLEFESDSDFLGGNDLYDLFDLRLGFVEGDEVVVGWIGHRESDFDLCIIDGVDWTIDRRSKHQ